MPQEVPQEMHEEAEDLRPARSYTDRELSGPGLRAFFSIAKLWGLKTKEQMVLLAVSQSTLSNWKRNQNVTLKRDTLERLSYILGIYKALQILFSDTKAADGWIKRPNKSKLFGGRSALDIMLQGSITDLQYVRRYLDSRCQVW